MRIVVILLIVAIALVYASPDYFDILDNEFEQELNGEERTFYIAAEESIWDYSSQSKNPNVTGDKKKKINNKESTNNIL